MNTFILHSLMGKPSTGGLSLQRVGQSTHKPQAALPKDCHDAFAEDGCFLDLHDMLLRDDSDFPLHNVSLGDLATNDSKRSGHDGSQRVV